MQLKAMLLNISLSVYHFLEKFYVKYYRMLLLAYFCEYKNLIQYSAVTEGDGLSLAGVLSDPSDPMSYPIP